MRPGWHVINFTDGVVASAADGDQCYDMMMALARRQKDVVAMFRHGEGVAIFRPQEAERIKAQRAQSRLVLPARLSG